MLSTRTQMKQARDRDYLRSHVVGPGLEQDRTRQSLHESNLSRLY